MTKVLRFVILLWTLISVATLPASPALRPEEAPVRYVILLVWDGVRPDILRRAHTPHVDRLMAQGTYTWKAWTVCPSVTMGAIPAIHTGAPPAVHQVSRWDGPIAAETLAQVFLDADWQAIIVNQDPIFAGYASRALVTGFLPRASPEEIMTLAMRLLKFAAGKPVFMSIYTPHPDRAGHRYGDGSSQYRRAIEGEDDQLGRLIQLLQEAGLWDRTLLVLTTDHGFSGTSHRGCRGTDMRTFSIWAGPNVKQDHQLSETAYIRKDRVCVAHTVLDLAPTISALAGVRAPAQAHGSVIEEILLGAPVAQAACPP